MSVETLDLFVTETWLRQNYPVLEHGSELRFPEGAKLTPAARGLLTDRKIKIHFGNDVPVEQEESIPIVSDKISEVSLVGSPETINSLGFDEQKKLLKQELLAEIWKEFSLNKSEIKNPSIGIAPSDGACALCSRPVNMMEQVNITHLNPHLIVSKNELRLRLKGKLESVLAQLSLLYAQLTDDGCHDQFIFRYIKDLRGVIVSVLAAVVEDTIPAELVLADMDEKTIANISANPLKYIGIDHLRVDGTQGVRVAQLEVLRTSVREAELEANAIYITNNFAMVRQDILATLNHLSHAVYVLMLFVQLSEQAKK